LLYRLSYRPHYK